LEQDRKAATDSALAELDRLRQEHADVLDKNRSLKARNASLMAEAKQAKARIEQLVLQGQTDAATVEDLKQQLVHAAQEHLRTFETRHWRQSARADGPPPAPSTASARSSRPASSATAASGMRPDSALSHGGRLRTFVTEPSADGQLALLEMEKTRLSELVKLQEQRLADLDAKVGSNTQSNENKQ
jgi:hypothetical protein